MSVNEKVFLDDPITEKETVIIEGKPIEDYFCRITAEVSEAAKAKGDAFAEDIANNMISDFKKEGDMMVHVSSYAIINGVIYMTYYANTQTKEEDPRYHKSRFVFCRADDVENKTYIDLQSAGDSFEGKNVDALYDTILMHKDDDVLYLMWTAQLSGNYYRLYRTYTISTGELGEIKVNRLKVGEILSDFSITAMQKALTQNGIGYKKMYTDIGIMQKLSSRVENGETYYYSGAYCGDFNFIIKSKDLVTWEYVSQPSFINQSKWENAVYVTGNRCFYFVRQDESPCGFLTWYDLDKDEWSKPVLIDDCQSRSDFIVYSDELYLFHAPVDREHLGVVHIDTENIENSTVVLQAKMHESCFYPFIQYGDDRLHLSYTSDRKHIRLSVFDAEKYLK